MTRTPPEVVCRQLVELVTDYLEDALSPELRDAVERHLAQCADCDGYVAQVRRMLELSGPGAGRPVPPIMHARLLGEFRRRPDRPV